MIEVLYNISIKVSVNSIEAGLLYKYLKIHPIENKCVNEGNFAFFLKDFEYQEEFVLVLNTAALDSCITVLEDQDLHDRVENLLKMDLLKKMYKWFDVIDNEESAIADFDNYYCIHSTEQFFKENDYFSFENYLKLLEYNKRNQNLIKQKLSFSEKVKQFFKL